jgi:AraC family transcriptional regulator
MTSSEPRDAGLLRPKEGPATGDKARLSLRGVEVLYQGRLVPLVPTRPGLSSLHAGWEGMVLETHITPICDHPYHEHPTHFLQLQTRGPVRFNWTTNGQTHSGMADPGTIFICPRGSSDSVQWEGPTNRVAIAIDPQLLTQSLEETSHRADIELTQHFQIHDRHIASLMLALRADLEDGLPAGRLYGQSLVTALAVYLQRRYAVFLQKTSEYRGGMPKARLNRVLEYISANLSEDIRLSELARTAGMSPHYFSELFKQTTGLSPHRYVLQQKIERAKQHLRDPNANVIGASAITGFLDQSYFTKVFRRMVGVTPTEFRNSVLGGSRRGNRIAEGPRFRVEV